MFTIAMKSIAFAWQTNRKLLLTLIILNIFQGSIVYLQFTSFSSIVNEIIQIKQGLGSKGELVQTSIMLGLSFLVPMLVGSIATHYKMIFRMQQNLQLEMYKIDKQSALDIGTIESSAYQNLLRSAQEWGTGSVLNLQDFIFNSASSFAGIITSIGILWSLSKWLVVFALLAATPVYFFYKKYSMEVFRIRYFSLDDNRIIGNRISHFEELQKAVDVILLKLKSWLKEQIRNRKLSYNEKVTGAERKKAISYSILSLWYLLFLFAAIALMTKDALSGSIAVGGLLLAFTTYTRFYQTINGYIESISYTEEAARYAARWFELFDIKPRIASKENAVRYTFTEPPLIEFRDVSFRYPGEGQDNPFVLQHLSFSIQPGKKVAIVGINGSGKTTLIKLLCRVYDPTEGSIYINGTDLKDIHLDDWQDAIGILFQDFPVYNLSIRESIGVGRMANPHTAATSNPVDENKLVQAARYSGADEFINEFPAKYDQLIWKEFTGGVDLSKGQHQRLAVARMFYRNAAVTILDEPTASIDAVTEEKIFSSLEKNMNQRTFILISHRFSTVKNADMILLLEHGKIIEQGSHNSLMQLKGKYADLYTMQAKRYLENSMHFPYHKQALLKKSVQRWAKVKRFFRVFGPGIITGASDDDPSGIATYSQAGAGFGLATLWTALITFPLMASIQEMCARIGIVTRQGLTTTLRQHYHKSILYLMMVFSFPAITLNIGADIQSMGAVANLLAPKVPVFTFSIFFTGLLIFLIIKYPYQKLAAILKWLCICLLLYMVVPFLVHANWLAVLKNTFIPTIHFNKEFIEILVALLGTTISPYLFFWQTTMEAEDVAHHPKKVVLNKKVLREMQTDVDTGMFFSNLVMFFIILTTGVVLYNSGIRQIDTVEQAAKALEPITGRLAYLLFTIGILGTGFLAIPVLAGSLSYIMAETFGWDEGLDKTFREAKGFYITMGASLIIGLSLDFLGISPIQALIYTAILYGITAPVMIAIVLHICNNKKVMGNFTNSKLSNILGIITFVVMTVAAIALLYFQFV
ncbi:hypothetical protein F5148DRAFT_1295592 [Russula earlei]|uniref:Uncharacterized protein n=1 Tax=Russula earlei TaxID=71964 RepID=A0ACC0TQS1_9AGAM|nr:hypothetical protein F5148DRAFT_1295592 [Russula earlei]